MTGFEPWTSGVGSNHYANLATTDADDGIKIEKLLGFLKGPFPATFFFNFLLFDTVESQQIFYIKVWIQTADLWSRKRLLYQLSHNQRPLLEFL